MTKNYFFTKYMTEEAQEWLSITKADLMIWLSLAIVIGLFFVNSQILSAILFLIIAGLNIYACFLGMQKNPNLMKFTYIWKLITYPLTAVLFIITSIFIIWNKYFAT